MAERVLPPGKTNLGVSVAELSNVAITSFLATRALAAGKINFVGYVVELSNIEKTMFFA